MRKYINPDLKVVELHKTDTIHTSVGEVTNNVGFIFGNGSSVEARTSGRRWDEWYEGY